MVVVSSITDPVALSSLHRLFSALSLQPGRGLEGGLGWAKPDSWAAEPLLPLLSPALLSISAPQAQAEAASVESEATAEAAQSPPPAVIGPAPRLRAIGPEPPLSSRPVIGPALPPIPLPTSPAAPPTSASSPFPPSPSDDEDALGPVPASELTAAEGAALAALQRARRTAAETREALASLRAQRRSSAASPHEEWMTVAPAGATGQAALLAAMTGERAMRPRGFSVRGGGVQDAGDRGDWTASPEEKELRRVEKEAERAADKAVAVAVRARAQVHGSAIGPRAPEVGVTVAQEAEAPSEASLLALHQRALEEEARGRGGGGSAVSRVGPIFWDREKEMGMRRQKTAAQISAEVRGAAQLSDRFASSRR